MERDLMRRVAAGDEAAFTQVYRGQAPLLFSVIFHILQDQKEAEDVLQESFVQMWQEAASYDADRSSISSWSVMLARHQAIAKLRSRPRSSSLVMEGTDQRMLSDRADTRVQKALRKIGKQQREAISLAFFSGLAPAQIADCVQAPLGTVKARIRESLSSLREALGGSSSTMRDRLQALS